MLNAISFLKFVKYFRKIFALSMDENIFSSFLDWYLRNYNQVAVFDFNGVYFHSNYFFYTEKSIEKFKSLNYQLDTIKTN